jgi:hypothetical protein
MATKLNQIIAVEKGAKTRAFAQITDAYQLLQKPAVLAGIARTYQPVDEDGEQYPPESTRVQVKAEDLIAEVTASLTELFDVTATKDWANCTATADIVVDGVTIVAAVPVTYLLFLEKQLIDFHTFVKKLPVLDPSDVWTFDGAADSYATEPVQTTKTKKVPRNHVKAEATKEHPAQVEVYHEDVVVGHWKTVKFSGALPAQRVNELTDRVERLQKAVKFAREEANTAEVEQQEIGAQVFAYLTGD